uniref:Uncharacterized protein n=1 Tax=Chlamydomonas leiostraca TaxID=1034604 RepID=A0A7S0R507_9CHLO|mmetsp:Transcript_13814/g.33974  ORF Transcript_13814/g.33974 Transcript_13814/m.33974 type:complete len:108 (+) Transcript_13814:179-502(+)|eukprot:CAMPEP_0202860578 /NCGR_PEP_ID=MMETSP1391-20130828/2231_1 /ASSEMBLY_ACC=CAM_ASM_000867 /TAXON_ID=1034604 /ORGANISM="Chlamydomonas leiostraca, Strain SAG 11-49" /LENGTH=107 /DNA_ID=CAMNT_0049539773 /DNA_START=198 /DNA_END=521 /DNA_ORIENTATION=-
MQNTSQQPMQQPVQAVFVDCVSGKHASTDPQLLCDKRRLMWRPQYGWVYDAWVSKPEEFSLAGANGRFSLPAIAGAVASTAKAAAQHIQHLAGQHLTQQQQQQQQHK